MAARNLRRSLAPVLFPLSLLYGMVTGIRNLLFDLKILKSVEFDFPVISVGNITVGGTGKTPHVEYLIELLSEKFKLAVLSRGYKRNTRGFILADKNTGPEEIGDESYQIHRKFDEVAVAVDEKRVHGIQLLKKKIRQLQCVILDDAYQHRHVHPGMSILLIDYHRPLSKDHLLPMGDLRERKHGISRANIVIVTKVPHDIKPIEKRLWIKDLDLFPYQFLYFTTLEYGKLTPVYGGKQKKINPDEQDRKSTGIILVTGIANPEPLIRQLKSTFHSVHFIRYPDHHKYSPADMDKMHQKLNALNEKNKLIVTTEKDAVKIGQLEDPDLDVKELMYYLPVKIKFIGAKQDEFNKSVLKYVSKNKRIGRLHS